MEGPEVAIAVLLEKIFICELYTGIYAENSLQQSILGSALPELNAAVVVFSAKVRTFFGTYIDVFRCHQTVLIKVVSKPTVFTFQEFFIAVQPFFKEINVKEEVIRQFSDSAALERVRGMYSIMVLGIGQNLTHAYRNSRRSSGYHITIGACW